MGISWLLVVVSVKVVISCIFHSFDDFLIENERKEIDWMDSSKGFEADGLSRTILFDQIFFNKFTELPLPRNITLTRFFSFALKKRFFLEI